MDPYCGFLGGWEKTEDATKETQKICDGVKCQVEQKTDKNYMEFKAVKYRSQIVAGENVLIKVHVGGQSYIHLCVFKALPCFGGGLQLGYVQQHETKDSPLEPYCSPVTGRLLLPERWGPIIYIEPIQEMCDKFKCQVEETTNHLYQEFKAYEYREFSGCVFPLWCHSWLIKVHVGRANYIHVFISQEMGGKPHLVGVEQDKTKEDPLVPFRPSIIVGGFSESIDANKETQRICNELKGQVEKRTSEEFKAVRYRFQIVSGTNFLIKVHVGGKSYIHLFVYEPLPCNGGGLELLGVQQHQTKDSPLLPFN